MFTSLQLYCPHRKKPHHFSNKVDFHLIVKLWTVPQLSQVLENPFGKQKEKTHSEKTIRDTLDEYLDERRKKELKIDAVSLPSASRDEWAIFHINQKWVCCIHSML